MTSLELVRQKAERAKEQFRDLDAEVRAFRDSKPYEVISDKDSHPGQIDYRLASVKPVPVRIAHIAGEVIHTLRSTLDHLAYQLLLTANPNAPEKERSRVDFPIYDPTKQTEADAFRKVQPLGVRAIDAIRKVKPYKGGNDLLWAISVLDNINKHRTLLFASVVHGKMDITDTFHALIENAWGIPMPKLESPVALFTAASGHPAEVGDVLHVGFLIDEELNKKLKFTFEVTLSESEIHAGEPVLEALQQMIEFVENLVSEFAPLLN